MSARAPRFVLSCGIALAMGLASLASQAAVTAFFSAGTTCGGAANATFTSSGPAVKVSLCVTTTAEAVCGATLQLQSASAAENGRFLVTDRTLAAAFPDPNAASLGFPVAVTNPPVAIDLGGTTNASTPTAAGSGILLATFDLAPQTNATGNTYVVSLGGFSALASEASNCLSGAATDIPLAASFTLNRIEPPLITSGSSATFMIGAPSSFTVTASGSPTPTLSLTGTLPAGITFTPATGVLGGTPASGTIGTYVVTLRATNSAGTDTRTFTLTIVKGNQTIAFTGPSSQPFTTAPIALTATASSGLAVTLASSTPSVCAVSGTTLTMVSAGTCTITANQPGDASYNPAPTVTQSFVISATLPGAPTIGTATPGDGRATISFTPPANNGGSAITAYTATCNPGAIAGTSSASPVIVTGLANGTAYTCSVTATNAVGTGPASANASVTPTASGTAPTIASPGLAVFPVGSASSFTVVATGTPPPTLSMSGTLPAGVAFNATSGVLAGTPALGTVGDYFLSFTATNANGSASQLFTLRVAKADQAITFAAPSNTTFSTTPITLSATASSGLAVTFSTTTPSICTVSGASLTMVSAGTCIVLADQAGNANYNPAPTVTRSFTIASGLPGAPAITSAVPFSGAALVYFSPPASTGGTAVTGYVVTCNPGSVSASGTTSPLRVAGLTNGATYSCTVAATNVNGTGPASAAVSVMPLLTRSFQGLSATGTGSILATFSGGGAGCGFTSARLIPVTGDPESPPPGSAPPNVEFPHGLFAFTLGGCSPGSSIVMTVTYPLSLPRGAVYWKYGPTPTSVGALWYILPASFNQSVAVFTIPDGGLGDDDRVANGTIVDQGGPGIGGGVAQIPTLGEWALMILAALLLALGMRRLHVTRGPGS